MREYSLIIRCEGPEQVAAALRHASAQANDDPTVFAGLSVDDEAECEPYPDGYGVESIKLVRTE